MGAVWFQWDCRHMLNACKKDKEGEKKPTSEADRESSRKPRTAGEALKGDHRGVVAQYPKKPP